MSDKKSTRRELLRPLHLLGIALAAGIFAAVVTLVSTGAFTARVNEAIARGTYQGLTPIGLGLVIGGGAFIATLLIMSMLILAVDPREYEDKTLDRPVLYDEEGGSAGSSADADASASAPAETRADASSSRAPAHEVAQNPASPSAPGASSGPDSAPTAQSEPPAAS